MTLPWRDFGIAVLISAAGLAALVRLVPTAPLTGDGEHYVAFARSHLQHGAASSLHARRILEPAIVAILPLDPLLSFHILTITSLFAAALLTWAAMLSLGFGGAASHTSIVLFLATWAVAPNLREYALVDPVAWAFVAAIWLAVAQRRWWLAAALGCVGVLAKEAVMGQVVVAAIAAWSPGQGWRGVARAGLLAAPAVVVLGALQVLLPGSGTDSSAYFTTWWRDGLGSLGPVRVVYLVLVSYGALWLLVPRGIPLLPVHIRRATLVSLCLAVVLPAAGSPERMEELIFPAVVTAAVAATRSGPTRVALALGTSNAIFVARVGGDAQVPSVAAWLCLLLAIGLALFAYRWKEKTQPMQLVH